MKIAFILGCGETGMFMPVGVGAYVIGVNDANKFSKPIDELVFINRPRHFQEPALYTESSRLTVIKNTKVKKIVTLTTLAREWEDYFPGQVHTITVTRWRKSVNKDQVYHVDNSPFTAMSLAVTYGYDTIVLWGVDFVNHRFLKPETSAPAFNQFAFAVSKYCKIYKGHSDSNLNLPIWSSQQ
jgi:hypothetical protein